MFGDDTQSAIEARLAAALRRIEKLEGTVAQLRVMGTLATYGPTRRELESLEERVVRLEGNHSEPRVRTKNRTPGPG